MIVEVPSLQKIKQNRYCVFYCLDYRTEIMVIGGPYTVPEQVILLTPKMLLRQRVPCNFQLNIK